MTPKKSNKDRYYIDNKSLYTALVKWRVVRDEATAAGKERPRVPDYIALAIKQITDRMATKYNFSRYTFNDEMRGDGMLNAVAAAYSFDVDKSTNPFGYFSICIYYAFIRRIQKEKEHLVGKFRVAELARPGVEAAMHGSQEEMPLTDILTNPYMMSLVESFERTSDEKKAAKTSTWKTKSNRIKSGEQK